MVLFVAALWTTSIIARHSALQQLFNRDKHVRQLYVANIRRYLSRYQYLPSLLARDQGLAALLDHPGQVSKRADVNRYLQFAAHVSGASAIYLIDRSGSTLAASNWNKPDSFIGHNYSFRPYFKQAMQGKPGRYYALGTASKRRGYYFTYPIREDGDIKGVVTVKVPLASLETTHGDKQYDFVVTDPNGVVFLSTRPAWRYHSLGSLTADQRQQIARSRRYAGHDLKALHVTQRTSYGNSTSLITVGGSDNGTTYADLNFRMKRAGWQVHIFSKVAEIRATVFNAVFFVGLGLAALLLISLIILQRRHQLAERRRFEGAALETAAANEARVRAIIDGTSVGLVAVDQNGRIQFFNPTAETMFAETAAAVEGSHFSSLIENSARAQFHDRLARALDAPNDLKTIELSGRCQSGLIFPMEVAISRVMFPEGPICIVSLRDISERKASEALLMRAHDKLEGRVTERTADLLDANRRLKDEIGQHQQTEAELRETRGELVQTAKLATIGQLSAGINHEINQPLTAIRSYAGNALVFLDRSQLSGLRDNLCQINALTDRIGRIVTELKLFARKSSGQSVPVSVSAVLDSALALLAPRLRAENVNAINSLPDHEMLCLADTVLLEQVMVNLISNAMQSVAGCDLKRVEITADRIDEHVQIRVRDFGTGISSANLTRIFDAFFTTKASGSGLGLGLSISLRIVEDLGGAMWAENHAQGGATFMVKLPASS